MADFNVYIYFGFRQKSWVFITPPQMLAGSAYRSAFRPLALELRFSRLLRSDYQKSVAGVERWVFIYAIELFQESQQKTVNRYRGIHSIKVVVSAPETSILDYGFLKLVLVVTMQGDRQLVQTRSYTDKGQR